MHEPSDKVKEAVQLYASLMEDIKERLDVIGAAVNTWQQVPPRFITEFCTLQFRMICEDIALGCLLAHGDIGSLQINNKLRDKWNAGDLMTSLSRLHPAFFPRAHTLTRPKEGEAHFTPAETSLTKQTLSEFYGRTGETLHRGTLVDRWAGKSTRPYTREEVVGTGQAIVDLLKVHLITLVDGTLVGCILPDLNQGGGANVFVAGLVPPPEPEMGPPPGS